MKMSVRLAYAANREIGFMGLRILLKHGLRPVALILPRNVTYAARIRQLVPDVPVLHGKEFRSPDGVDLLRELNLDYILSVHFPYIIPKEVLDIPRIGVLNLHPAYLPYNRGWHTPSWAILEETPYGATLHWVDEGIDTGDIAIRRLVEVKPQDTAHTLYQRVMQLELEVLEEALPLLMENTLPRIPQEPGGSTHVKTDLCNVQRIDLDAVVQTSSLLRQLRALTTNRVEEAAYFEWDGRRYAVRIEVTPVPTDPEIAD